MNKNKNVKASGMAYLFISTIIWGSSFAVVKDSLKSLTPMWNLAIRFLYASVFMFIFCHKSLKGFSVEDIKKGVILGIILFSALFFQSEGLNRTTAGKSAFLTDTYVVFIPFVQLLWKKAKLNLNNVVSAIICMVGVAFITLDKGLSLELGDALCLICGLIYTIYIIKIGDIPKKVSSEGIHTIQILSCGILALLAAIVLEAFPRHVTFVAAAGTFYCGVFELGIGFLFQLKGQKVISPAVSGIIMSLESVVSCVFSYFILGESVSYKMLIGCILILSAIVISQLGEKGQELQSTGEEAGE